MHVIWKPILAAGRKSGITVIGPDRMKTAHGLCSGVVTIRSRSPANGWGPAEVEGVLTSHPAVSEAATIGAPDELKGQVLVCFVVLKPGATVETSELISHVAMQMGKPLAPKAVHIVSALPKTRSGKILRGMILRVYTGQPVGDLTSVENPHTLDTIKTLGNVVK